MNWLILHLKTTLKAFGGLVKKYLPDYKVKEENIRVFEKLV